MLLVDLPNFIKNSKVRIVNGALVPSSKTIPWQAAIFSSKSNKKTFLCGGTIISRTIILSSTGCVRDLSSSELAVLYGQRNFDETKLKLVKHVSRNLKNNADLAVLYLAEKIEANSLAQPICLPSEGFTPEQRSKCYVSGWGAVTKSKMSLLSGIF